MKDVTILFLYPSRSRPKKFQEGLDSIKSNLVRPELAEFVFVADEDDAAIEQYLEIYRANNVIYYGGKSDSKIHAVNRGMAHAPNKWDIVFLMSDDMFVTQNGFDDTIRNDFAEHFPDGDGLLHYNDGFQKGDCCTLSIIGRKYYERDGYVYNPNYTGLWCDVEATEVAHIRGKHKYMGDNKILFKHVHPATQVLHPLTHLPAVWDEQYRRDENMKIWGEDGIVLKYHRECFYGIPISERANGFLFDKEAELIQRESDYRKEFGDEFQYPKLKIQILICSLPERKPMLDNLVAELSRQFIENGTAQNGCILIDDAPKNVKSIGAKRNGLLKQSTSEYVAYFDDDDFPEPNYISDITAGANACSDCCSMMGIITFDGEKPEVFEHSLKYSEWKTNDTGAVKYERNPNHLNLVKRSIAIQMRFPESNHGEDHDYSKQLAASGLIKHEHYIDRPIYNYRFKPNK